MRCEIVRQENYCQKREADQAPSVWVGKVVERIRTCLHVLSFCDQISCECRMNRLGSCCFLPLLGAPEPTLYGQTSAKTRALTDVGFFHVETKDMSESTLWSKSVSSSYCNSADGIIFVSYIKVFISFHTGYRFKEIAVQGRLDCIPGFQTAKES